MTCVRLPRRSLGTEGLFFHESGCVSMLVRWHRVEASLKQLASKELDRLDVPER